MTKLLPRLYLDSSIPSAYYNNRNRERQLVTQRVWHEVLPNYHLMISNITLRELGATKNKSRRRKLLTLVQRLDTIVLTSSCSNLAFEYLKYIAMPQNDALHTAIATVFSCEILLSWNFTHLVNYENKQRINGINLIHGYKAISIISPYEL